MYLRPLCTLCNICVATKETPSGFALLKEGCNYMHSIIIKIKTRSDDKLLNESCNNFDNL